jgi:IPT/TIG domain
MISSTRFSRRTAIGAAATVGLAALATGLAVTPAMAVSVPMTLSAVSGPSGGTNTLTGTTTTAKFFSGAVVQFQYKVIATTACSAAYSTPVTPSTTAGIVNATPKILSSMKIAATVPASVALQGSATSANWLVCVYPGTNTTTSLLAANAAYTIAARPTIATPFIAPASGPALGGGTVTVTGTNFIAGLTAKIGSVALTGITVVSGTTFTATVPPQAAATGLTLSVTTTGGTATRANSYSYTNGIVVEPSTTPTATAATDIDVQGVGFSGMSFTTTTGTTPDDNNAHVYLVAGSYDPTDASSAKTKAETGECVNVLVVSDTELICTLNTDDAYNQTGDPAIANGVYTLTVVTDGGIDVQTGGANANANYAKSIISSGSTFTVAPY